MDFINNRHAIDDLDSIEKVEIGDKVVGFGEFDEREKNLNKKPAIPEERIGNKKKAKKIERRNSKEAAIGVSGAPNFVAPQRRWKNSRRSRSGYGRGLPKKGGAGGKGVWGKLGSEILEDLEDDADDPNYDADTYNNVELKEIVPEITLEEFTKKFEPVILEYYDNGDTHEVADSLDEFLTGNMRAYVIKVAIEIACDHKQSHREMTSVLISDLYGRVITSKDIVRGFDLLLEDLPDLILDLPDAPKLLGNFMARAVADDCIPPRYITQVDDVDKLNTFAQAAIKHAHTHLSMQTGWAHLDNVWGVAGGLRPVKTITTQMNLLLREYVLSRDVEEAHRCIRQLEVPHFHHELVYETVVMTLEAVNDSFEEAMCNLLKSVDTACIVSPDMMEQGFQRIFDDMADISIDIPLAYIVLDRFLQRCYRAGFISDKLIKNQPSRGRKRFVSEGDGGHIKPINMQIRDF